MSEAANTLARQIEEWEAKVEAAHETLRIGESILPHLRDALHAEVRGEEPPQASPAAPQEKPAEESTSDSGPRLHVIKSADEVQGAVAAILEELPRSFEQGAVHDKLEQSLGFEVNRSTLRQNLLLMAKAEEGFRVARPGKGRKATIFEQMDAGAFP